MYCPEAHQRRIAFLLELADLVGLAGEAVTHGLQAIDLIGQFCGLLRMACLHLRASMADRLRASKGFDEALRILSVSASWRSLHVSAAIFASSSLASIWSV